MTTKEAALIISTIVLLFFIWYKWPQQSVDKFYTAYSLEDPVRQYPPFTGNLPAINLQPCRNLLN
jgi:hypothetical protein